jgi:hypothetical protein
MASRRRAICLALLLLGGLGLIWASDLAGRLRQHPALERFATDAKIARDHQD